MVRIERQDPQIKSHSCTLRVMLTSLTLVMGNPVEIAYVCLSPRDSILQLAKQRSLESFDTNLRNQFEYINMRKGIKLIIIVLNAAVLPPSTVPDYSTSLRGLPCLSA